MRCIREILSSSLFYSYHIGQCLTHKKSPIDICWKNKLINVGWKIMIIFNFYKSYKNCPLENYINYPNTRFLPILSNFVNLSCEKYLLHLICFPDYFEHGATFHMFCRHLHFLFTISSCSSPIILLGGLILLPLFYLSVGNLSSLLDCYISCRGFLSLCLFSFI